MGAGLQVVGARSGGKRHWAGGLKRVREEAQRKVDGRRLSSEAGGRVAISEVGQFRVMTGPGCGCGSIVVEV